MTAAALSDDGGVNVAADDDVDFVLFIFATERAAIFRDCLLVVREYDRFSVTEKSERGKKDIFR